MATQLDDSKSTAQHTTEKANADGLLHLAELILQQTTSISSYLRRNAVALPTFDTDSSEPPETAEYQALHSSLTSTLEDLQYLMNGPRACIRSYLLSGFELAAVQIAFEFDFFKIIPEKGEIEVGELAKKAGMDADRAARVLRILATRRIFQEKTPGYFSQTAASLAFAKDEEMKCAGQFSMDELWKAATSSADCIKASPYESDSAHSPFSTRHGLPMFDFYAKNPKYAARFAKAMGGITRVDRQITELKDGFPWGNIQGTVVDVGGGSGHVSIALARAFPHLSFIVQDGSADMLAQGKKLDLHDIEGRVTWMQHNFFQPQPLCDVAAFFIRQCTHNWCDHDVVTILKSFVPGLEGSKRGTPLLINDTIIPEPGTRPAHEERGLRQMDMMMFVNFGAKERTKKEFEALLKEADPRYEIHNAHADGAVGLLEVHLTH
ncbi:O-methyltransferase [Hypoxylon sp. FL0890]|nr:O-methyltransferase [Hypoxylon sp. FL0890]